MSARNLTRRQAVGLTGVAVLGCTTRVHEPATLGFGTAAPVQAPERPEPPVRPAPGDELVNTLEFEAQAQLALPAEVHAEIAGSDREPFDRLTFRPRMNVPTLDMDLSVALLGQTLFAPVVGGPIAEHGRYHPDGELATAKGAAEAHTVLVVSGRSSVPFEQIAAQSETPLWYGVNAADDGAGERARAAAAQGARAVVVTLGPADPTTADNGSSASTGPVDWRAIRSIRDRLEIPVVIKGVMSREQAATAVEHGAHAVVVSNHGGSREPGEAAPMDVLASIVDELGGHVPVLVDGSFRRGTDVLKALILGARAVLVARPIAWGLAAYGPDGVRWVLQLMQNELARCFGMLGASTPAQLTRAHIRTHRRATG